MIQTFTHIFRHLTLLLGLIFFFAHAEEGVIRVSSHVEVNSRDPLLLGQILQFQHVPDHLMQELNKIPLGDAPAMGEVREFSNVAISSLLRLHLPSQADYRLVIPSRVVIAAQPLKMDEKSVTDILVRHWQNRCRGCRVEIENLSVPRWEAHRSQLRWSLDLKDQIPRGSFSVMLRVESDSSQSTTYWVRGQLRILTKTPVARRSLAIGERLTAEDFEWRESDVTHAVDGVPTEEDLVGKVLSRATRARDIIWLGALVREKALKRGDLVKVRAREGSWEITTSAIADSDGYEGDVVNVRNPKSNRVYSAIVRGSGWVEIQ